MATSGSRVVLRRRKRQRGVDLGGSALDPCDRCGARGYVSWINGVAGQYDGFHIETETLVAPSNDLAAERRPDRLVDYSIYLCRDCLTEAIRRTFTEGTAPDTIPLGNDGDQD